MRISGAMLLLFVLNAADAEQPFPPYGLDVSDSELRFMSGMHSLAVDLELGRGAAPDYTRAAEAYRKAAVLGYPLAQNNLARLYESGLGVPLDPVLAHVWYELAAASGEAVMIENRDRSARQLLPAQMDSAETLARTLKQHLPASAE